MTSGAALQRAAETVASACAACARARGSAQFCAILQTMSEAMESTMDHSSMLAAPAPSTTLEADPSAPPQSQRSASASCAQKPVTVEAVGKQADQRGVKARPRLDQSPGRRLEGELHAAASTAERGARLQADQTTADVVQPAAVVLHDDRGHAPHLLGDRG